MSERRLVDDGYVGLRLYRPEPQADGCSDEPRVDVFEIELRRVLRSRGDTERPLVSRMVREFWQDIRRHYFGDG